MVPQKLQPYRLYEWHNALGPSRSTRLYTFIERHYYWKKSHQDCNMYVRSCTECQQATLKEPCNINLYLPILQFPMVFISMDLLGPQSKIESGNQYMRTIICMLTIYVFIIPIKTETKEDVINVYLKHLYAIFGSSKYILSDRERECFSKQFTWLANEVGFTKRYTSPYTPTGNAVIGRMHSFLKAS